MSKHKSREWDSKAYDRISGPQYSWGKKVLQRVKLSGHERVLDAGCGTGKLTAELLTLLPQGRVIGVDLSQNMLCTARENLAPPFGSRVGFLAADLLHLPFDSAFDGIFSTAAFHWVRDHDLLFGNLFRALRPEGWVVAQCGGAGNLERFLAQVAMIAQSPKYASYVGGYRHTWEFADAATTARRLRAAGFESIETGIEAAPTSFENETQFAEFASKVILHRLLEHFPDKRLRHEFMHEVAARTADGDPPYTLDYWRLNLEARKPAKWH